MQAASVYPLFRVAAGNVVHIFLVLPCSQKTCPSVFPLHTVVAVDEFPTSRSEFVQKHVSNAKVFMLLWIHIHTNVYKRMCEYVFI